MKQNYLQCFPPAEEIDPDRTGEHRGKPLPEGSVAPPLRDDAFLLSGDEKVELISGFFASIMETLGLDLADDSLRDTPRRVAQMYVNEIFRGLDPANKPRIALFENRYRYAGMLIEKDIAVHSFCEHHFVPFVGKAHVAYISCGKVIGLSKLNRIVKYFSQRPQVQERLTVQIASELCRVLETRHVAVVIEARHHCISSRGVSDASSSTVTAHYSGDFSLDATRNEFLRLIKL